MACSKDCFRGCLDKKSGQFKDLFRVCFYALFKGLFGASFYGLLSGYLGPVFMVV